MLTGSCLSYTKFEIIQLPQEESAAKPNVSRKDAFVSAEGLDTAFTYK